MSADDLLIQAVIEAHSEMFGSSIEEHQAEIARLQQMVSTAYWDMMQTYPEPGADDDE